MSETDKSQSEIVGAIDGQLLLGWHSPDEVAEFVVDVYGDDDEYPGDEAVARLVEDRYAQQLAEQARWARPTDLERLDRAFRKLEEIGILARHHYGSTRSDGLSSLMDEAERAQGAGREVRGYVYYTHQDSEHALDGSLTLAFGAFARRGYTFARLAAETVAVGLEVSKATRAQQLELEGVGGYSETLVVRPLRWQNPKDPKTKRSMLSNPQVPPGPINSEAPAVQAAWRVTIDGEWHLGISFLAFDQSNQAERVVDWLAQAMPGDDPKRYVAPGAFDSLWRGEPRGGRRIRLDVWAAPGNRLNVVGRRNAVVSADMVILLTKDEDEVVEGLDEVRRSLEQCGRPREAWPSVVLWDSSSAASAPPPADDLTQLRLAVDRMERASAIAAWKESIRLVLVRLLDAVAPS